MNSAQVEFENRSGSCQRVLNATDWVGVGLGLILFFVLITHRPQGLGGLTMVQDDFFYYAKIGASIASGHGSTFNGLVATNGYHPLWLGVVTLLCLWTRDPDKLVFAVNAISAISTLATYDLTKLCLRTISTHRWAPRLLAAGFAFLCLDLFRSGMEVILTIPLAIGLLYRLIAKPHSPLQMFITSVVACLVVLSRLDSAIWVAALGLSIVLSRCKVSLKQSIAAALGFLPLLVYLILNKAFFGTLMPVSGAAKQLRTVHTLSPAILGVFRGLTIKEYLVVVLAIAGLILTPLMIMRLPRIWRIVAIPTVVFPVIHFLVLSFLSDWPVWSWYFYSSVLAGFITLALVTSTSRPRIMPFVGFSAMLFCVACAAQLLFQPIARPRGRVLAGGFLRDFSTTHKGVYAMGDRAGIAGMLMSSPIVQTEGLVMDKGFIAHLQKQDDLIPVLQSYGVRYYVANFYGNTVPTGCFAASEPSQAGPTAKHMRSTICTPPIATFSDLDAEIAIYDIGK